jgi:folate-binding protein YgfZ
MSIRRSPLFGLQASGGTRAATAVFQGWELPAAFLGAEHEVRAALSGCVMFDAAAWGRIRVRGRDGLDLLHRLSTNDLLSLKPGESAQTVLTTEKGRIVDAVRVLRGDRESLLLTSPGAEEMILGWIEKYTITEDVQLSIATADTCMITLIGPESGRLLGELVHAAGSSAALREIPALTPGTAGSPAAAQGLPAVEAVRESAAGLDMIHLVVRAADGERLWSALVGAGITPAGIHAREILRIMHGIPGRPGELNLEFNPYDAGLLGAVSFTKGCYIGQEVIARLDTYQKVRRRLAGLVSQEADVAPGTTLTTRGGEEAGRVTSWSPVPFDGWWLGLAVVRSDRGEEGSTLAVGPGDAPVRIGAFPLRPGS